MHEKLCPGRRIKCPGSFTNNECDYNGTALSLITHIEEKGCAFFAGNKLKRNGSCIKYEDPKFKFCLAPILIDEQIILNSGIISVHCALDDDEHYILYAMVHSAREMTKNYTVKITIISNSGMESKHQYQGPIYSEEDDDYNIISSGKYLTIPNSKIGKNITVTLKVSIYMEEKFFTDYFSKTEKSTTSNQQENSTTVNKDDQPQNEDQNVTQKETN